MGKIPVFHNSQEAKQKSRYETMFKKVLLSFTPSQLVEVINHISDGSKGKVDQAFTVICGVKDY